MVFNFYFTKIETLIYFMYNFAYKNYNFLGETMIEKPVWAEMKKIGISKIARQMGITRANFYQWRNSKPVPDGRLLELEKVTGIARHLLKPRLFENYSVNKTH